MGVLALVDLGVPLGVCAVFEARLATVFFAVGFALDAVTFFGIVQIRDARSRRTREEWFVACSCFDALMIRVGSLASTFELQCWKVS